MNNLDSITGFHIEPTNICTLKCEGCSRTRFIRQWPQHWQNHCLDVDVLLKFLDIDLSGKKITLCGNYGDPIYHTDFINFVAKLKNTGALITITTNGSHRTVDWWKELTSILGSQDTVRFSVDGVPDNFTQYRKNADWPSIRSAMEVCAASLCQTVWKYIPFAFNQENIEQAKNLAHNMGIDNFLLDPSDRFDEVTDYLRPESVELIGQKFDSIVAWKKGNTDIQVDAKCKKNGREHFVTSDGFYSPCCFVADHRFYYKTPFGKNKKLFDIRQSSLSQLLQLQQTTEWFETLPDQGVCKFNCPQNNSIV